MPYKVVRAREEWCVRKLDGAGEPTGDPLGCHPSEGEASAQMRALYANEPGIGKAVKFADGSEVDIEGLLAPHGGSFNGRDIQGEYFSAKTDFALGWFEDRPLLFQHGMDGKAGLDVVGRIKTLSRDEAGLWMKAQLDAHTDYYESIRQLVKAGKLGLSSGSMRHLVQVDKSGQILRWPLIEGSLTPTPANPLAEVDFATAKSHYKAIGLDMPDDIPQPIPDWLATALNMTALEETQDTLKAFQTVGLVEHADFAALIAATLLERTKDLQERRVKAGRVISSMNRKRLGECLASMRMAADDLSALLDSTDPAKAEAKAQVVRRLRVQLEATRLRSLSI